MYFFTLATHQRRAILTTPAGRACLRRAIREEQARRDFRLPAIVLLPDHLHMLVELPAGDDDYSRRLAGIKHRFTRAFLAGGGTEGVATGSRRRQRYRGVWQKRFYEHCIRDYRDYKLHLDYIHVNAVKHGLAEYPRDWPWSTFPQFVRQGEYDNDWCGYAYIRGQRFVAPELW